MKNNRAIKIFTAAVIAATLCFTTSCSSESSPKNEEEKLSVYGGDAVYYSYYVLPNESELATIPIITKSTLKSASLNSVETDKTDTPYTFTAELFDIEEGNEYKGYNLYALSLRIEADDSDSIVPINVTGINVTLNDELVHIDIPHFKITNGIEGIDPDSYDDRYLLYGGNGGQVIVYPELPSEHDPAEIGLIATKELTIDSFIVPDYFTIDNFKVDGEKADNNNIGKTLKFEETTVFTCSMDYANGSNEAAIVRTARIVTYTVDNEKRAFIDGAANYVFPGYDNIQALKDYIDKLDK